MLASALAAIALASCAPAGETADKPSLKLLTTLPIMFSGQFSLDGGSALLEALEARYAVEAIAATDAQSLSPSDVLFMAHALPQTAENLVFLDEWVRSGGRVLLLADPQLDWDSELGLGHPQAPPYYFGDTGLLGHWGLTLEGPRDATEIADVPVSSAGRLVAADDRCAIAQDALVARCRVGEGEAVVIADADYLLADDDRAIAFTLEALGSLAR